MKIEYKVIALSIIIGLFVWVIDAFVDYFYFYQEPFQNVLIPEASSFEFYIRLTWMAFFLIFGLIASRIIAKLKQTEEELLKFKMGIERSNEATFMTDINGTIVYANPAFEKKYGYSQDELTRMHISAIKHPDSNLMLDKDSLIQDTKHEWKGNLVSVNRHGIKLNMTIKCSPVIKDNRHINLVFVLREQA